MAISRPTFTRLIEKARNKIARAIIDGLELVVEGGNIEFQNTLRRCLDCGDEQIIPYNEDRANCPECGSENVEDLAKNFIDHEKQVGENKKENVEMMNSFRKSGSPGGGQGLGRGGGRGRNKGGAFGTGGFCVCAKCGEKVPHQQGVKCTTVKCPQCGHTMIREELLNQ
jgi:DNA-directed RNA polymerase subunit RPC12/RpoP